MLENTLLTGDLKITMIDKTKVTVKNIKNGKKVMIKFIRPINRNRIKNIIDDIIKISIRTGIIDYNTNLGLFSMWKGLYHIYESDDDKLLPMGAKIERVKNSFTAYFKWKNVTLKIQKTPWKNVTIYKSYLNNQILYTVRIGKYTFIYTTIYTIYNRDIVHRNIVYVFLHDTEFTHVAVIDDYKNTKTIKFIAEKDSTDVIIDIFTMHRLGDILFIPYSIDINNIKEKLKTITFDTADIEHINKLQILSGCIDYSSSEIFGSKDITIVYPDYGVLKLKSGKYKIYMLKHKTDYYFADGICIWEIFR